MIGAAVRIQLGMARAKALGASQATAPGIAAAIALEAQLSVHATMAIGSPQPLANNFFLPVPQFEIVCRLASDIEGAIGALASHEMDLEHFQETLASIAEELDEIASDEPQLGPQQSVYAAPAGSA